MTDHSWIQTYTGRKVHPLSPDPATLDIEDIAHSLSMQCRYAGHSRYFYSVAEHSVLVAGWLLDHTPETALWGLLHDASEAYLVDIPRPVKAYLNGYRRREDVMMRAIGRRFGLAGDAMPAPVKEADDRILSDERAVLMAAGDDAGWPCLEPLGVTIECWAPEFAKLKFLALFYELTA